MKQQQLTHFGGKPVLETTIENRNGIRLKALNYGCVITEILLPDRNGKLENVVLHYDDTASYKENPGYLGAIIGRTAGRIKEGRFALADGPYQVAINDGNNSLHGGHCGFSHQFWEVNVHHEKDAEVMTFHYHSPAGEEGYPGNMSVQVSYTLTAANTLTMEYRATSDADTPCNLTNHTYFNLSGNGKRDISQQHLTLSSSSFLEVNDESLPTGEVLPVADHSVFDFREGKELGEVLNDLNPHIQTTHGGLDHPFLLDDNQCQFARLYDRISGRTMKIETTSPAVVCYSGNKLEDGSQHRNHAGICFETQHPPATYHLPQFGDPILQKGEVYQKQTSYHFSW
ncbi:aldose epimerase family protein [Salsuginibacillus kocurii]|uniref:aldose epimerase family protein n=1 Tax=Salsuginibacillus kocurii TaxID=427078 RepID=UPI0003668C62|nr:aldose epimerase family protein [Salsuginibacillus kocurii]